MRSRNNEIILIRLLFYPSLRYNESKKGDIKMPKNNRKPNDPTQPTSRPTFDHRKGSTPHRPDNRTTTTSQKPSPGHKK